MTPWLIPGIVVAVCAICFWTARESSSTKSKYFKLHLVLIDPKRAPDFSVTVLKGDFPEYAEPGFVTYIQPHIAMRLGLKSHQIVGCLKYFRGGWDSENFFGNKAFKDRIHAIAATEIPESIRDRAKILTAGDIRLIDDRITAAGESADDEDCIGFYKVENGVVVAYTPNPKFQLFSAQGPVELVKSIRDVLYSEIESAIHAAR